MIKKIFAIITAVIICLSSSLFVSAYTYEYTPDGDSAEEYIPDEIYEDYFVDEEFFSNEEYFIDEEYEALEKSRSIGVPFIWLPISLIIGLVIGFLIINGIASKNKSVRMQKNATVYERPESMVITNSADVFLHKNIERRPKPKQPPKK